MNRLTLAVAGGRKTQSIIDSCQQAPPGRRILVVTYTQMNQAEVSRRLAAIRPLHASVEVQGWFSFLLQEWVRPYLPLLFADQRLRGFNFDGDPGRFATGQQRYLDSEGRAYKRHLAHLALKTCGASKGAVIDRLSRIYHEIYIDEVQDLNGYDLEILAELFASSIDMHLVGDIRQALIMTNVQDPKNKQYKGINIGNWFDKQAKTGSLDITHQSVTWRSNQAIANFADTVFGPEWGFPATTSMNQTVTGHDGLFAVALEHAHEYVKAFTPLCLRHSASCAKDLNLDFHNIGIMKGASVKRVLLAPTENVVKFLCKKILLEDAASCSLYVAVTRAEASVAILCKDPARTGLPVWIPSGD